MKTLTKILSVTALIVLCVCLFTLTAFAANEKFVSATDGKAATCTEPGTKPYITVKDDADQTAMYTVTDISAYSSLTEGDPVDVSGLGSPIDAPEEIPAKNHKDDGGNSTLEEGPNSGKEPNCTEPGYKTYYICTQSCCAGKFFDKNGNELLASKVIIYPTPEDDDSHDWQPDTSKSKAPNQVDGGWTYYVCSRDPSHTKKVPGNIVEDPPLDPNPNVAWNDLEPVIALRDTWFRGEETLLFESEFVKRLNDETGPSRNRVGLRIGNTRSLYDSTYYTYDFWSYDKYVEFGDKMLNGLEEGTYYLWIYDRDHPERHTDVVKFYVVDVPTLEPYSTDKHVVNSSKSLRFVASEEIDPNSVKVGSKKLYDSNDYFVSNDRKNITLSPDFLNARQTGTYTISARTKGGDTIKTNFYILSTAQASSSPRTGDESQIGLWAAFLLLSGAAIVVMVPKLRKHGAK